MMIKKIRDRVLLGTIAGIMSSGMVLIFQQWALRAGWMTKTWAEQAEGATVSRKYLRTKPAAALGWFTSISINAFAAIGQTYMFTKTGRDHIWVKSAGLGVFSWMLLHGLSSRLTQSFRPDDSPPRSAFSSLVSAVLDSCISGVIITKLGDDSLFPEQGIATHVKTRSGVGAGDRSTVRMH